MTKIIEHMLQDISVKKTNKEKYDVINTTIDEIDKYEYTNARELRWDCKALDLILTALYAKKATIWYESTTWKVDGKLYVQTQEVDDFYMEYLTLRFELTQLYDFNTNESEPFDRALYQVSLHDINHDEATVLTSAQQVYEKLAEYKLQRSAYKNTLSEDNRTRLVSAYPNPTDEIVNLTYKMQIFSWEIHNTFWSVTYQWFEEQPNWTFPSNSQTYEWPEEFNPLHGLPKIWKSPKDIDELVDKWVNSQPHDFFNLYHQNDLIHEPGAWNVFSTPTNHQTASMLRQINSGLQALPIDWAPWTLLTTFPMENPETKKPRASIEEAKDRARQHLIDTMKQKTLLLKWYPKVYAMDGKLVAESELISDGNLQGEFTASVDLWGLPSWIYVVVVPNPDGKGLISKKIVKR